MRLLIIGSTGMLGHRVARSASLRSETWATIRTARPPEGLLDTIGKVVVVPAVDVESWGSVAATLEAVRPDVVVNCAGVVKQVLGPESVLSAIRVNSLFPQELALRCRSDGTRLIQISTDCVFSGSRGAYRESDVPDPSDAYGASKLLGEPTLDGCLVLRTSMIGRELATSHGLLEWFLAQQGPVSAWSRAVFSGMTTPVLAELIVTIALEHPELAGLWHVGGPPISKADLLALLRDVFEVPAALELDNKVVIDRSLDSSRFSKATGWLAPDWSTMVQGLAADPLPYRSWRSA